MGLGRQLAATGAYFGQDCRRIVGLLLGEQLPDVGSNCEAATGSKRSSFNTTSCVLEAMLEVERAGGGRTEETQARLRGLEYQRRAGATPGERVTEAIELGASKRDRDGRWPLENRHRGTIAIEIDEGEGRPDQAWSHGCPSRRFALVVGNV